jgi:CxxC-x17-CxxC domain-containing protein
MGEFNRDRGPRKDFGPRRDGPRQSFGPREMHKAKCADCGEECEVPFEPKEGRDVFCRDCFGKRKKY